MAVLNLSSIPSRRLEQVLGKTLGVPLFQEQAMCVAIVGACFTPGEADQLRKSMATFKFTGGVSAFRDELISGVVAHGYDQAFAEQTSQAARRLRLPMAFPKAMQRNGCDHCSGQPRLAASARRAGWAWNTTGLTDYFRLPPDTVVEIGRPISI
jgi:hypothetical protein